ncbi:MAG: hypothetical protein ACQSGP_31175 [Frankia sp.]
MPTVGRTVRVVRTVLVLIGLAALGYGVHGALGAHRLSNPRYSLTWAIVAIVFHDAVLVPAVAVVGVLLSRLLPAPYRAVVQVALFVSGTVALTSLPLWRGYTSNPGNATVDPLPYDRNLVIVLGTVWFVAAVILIVRRFRPKRPGRPGA